MNVQRAVVWAAAVLLLGGTVAGCGDERARPAAEEPGRAAPQKPDSKTLDSDDDHTVLRLSDGRELSLTYAKGRGLEAKHRDAAAEAWSAPKTVYATAEDPCQGIEAKAYRGTVWVVAGFGTYCRDGEEPQDVLAAVGTGDLSTWATSVVSDQGFEPKPRVRGAGARVDFVDRSWIGTTTLTWKKPSGFASPTETYRPIHKWFVGRWRSQDGTQQLTIDQAAGSRSARLTIESVTGPRCKGTAMLTGLDQHDLTINNFKLEEGTKTAYCPPEDETEYSFAVDSADGPLRLVKIGNHPKTVRTYERAE
ncbi:hypothetical protein ACFW9D_25210 [Streptomyces sp. NPDC059524]|uniref:hypothetical protein n=1 Tax=Streptomyces sp. NPDC059524 TaxID=3346856 RepID=UPI0036CB3E18